MGQAEKWAANFGISPADLAQWKTSAGSETDLLRWCLLNGKLDERGYIDWAMKAFELPSVKNDFFAIHADLIFWESVKHRYAWTPSLFPLADWQGVLLIACLEPPQEFRLREPHRFVLANARELHQLWMKFNPTWVAKAPPTPSPVVAPPAPTLEAPDGISLDTLDGIQFDLSTLTANAAGTQEPAIEAPEGLSAQAKAGAPTETLLPDLGELAQASSEAPEGVLADTASSFVNLDFSALEHPVDTSAKGCAIAETNPTIVDHVNPDSNPTIPLLTPVEAATAPNVIQFPPSQDTGRIVPSTLDPLPVETCKTKDALANHAMAHVLKTFEHGVFFLVENGNLTPWKWTDRLIVTATNDPSPVSVESPSIFRIAFRTQLPYHGYVTPSPANNQFFTEFCQGAFPKHVTLVPVVVNGSVVAMIMGLTDTEIAYRNSLVQMERLSEAVARRMSDFQLAS